MNIQSYKKWSPEETNIFKKNIVKYGPKKTAIILKRSTSSIRKKQHSLGIKIPKKTANAHKYNLFDVDVFTKKQNPESCYLLGLIWADGHVRKKSNGISFSLVGNDFLKIKPVIDKTIEWNIYKMKPRLGKTAFCASTSHKELHNFLVDKDYLIKSGACANKILSATPENLRHYWWRGYFDGDGCLCVDKKRTILTITSCYNQNWDFAKNLCNKLKISFSIARKKHIKGNSSIFYIRKHNHIVKFGDYIYNGLWFGFKRKYNKFKIVQDKINTIFSQKTSNFRGVWWSKQSQSFLCRIQLKGKIYCLGSFNDEKLAAKTYNNKAIELYGDGAVLNVI